MFLFENNFFFVSEIINETFRVKLLQRCFDKKRPCSDTSFAIPREFLAVVSLWQNTPSDTRNRWWTKRYRELQTETTRFARDTLITRHVRASRKLIVPPIYLAHTRVIPDQRVLLTADCIFAEYIHANEILFPVPEWRILLRDLNPS